MGGDRDGRQSRIDGGGGGRHFYQVPPLTLSARLVGCFNTVDFYGALPGQGSLHWSVGWFVCLEEEGGSLEH